MRATLNAGHTHARTATKVIVSVAVVRELTIQELMQRRFRFGHLPAIRVAVPLPALDADEFSLPAPGLERCGDPLTLRDIDVVITGPVYREHRNVGSRECDRGDVPELRVGPRWPVAHHIRENALEVGHHLFGRHRHVVFAVEVDGDFHPAGCPGGVVAQGDHRRQMTAG